MPENGRGTPGSFPEQVALRETRKLRARRKKATDVLSGLGLFGTVGWSVAVPAVLGVFAGAWIDLRWPGPPSWTLMLMLLGLVVGCANAWFWLSRQRRTISGERDNDRK